MNHMNKLLKYAKVGYSYFRNRRMTAKSIKRDKMCTGPWTAYLILTSKCNCRCMQCSRDIEGADREKPSDYLSIQEYYDLIDQLIDSGCYRIGLSGGEPLLFKEKLLKLAEKINEKAYSQLVTNGELLDGDFLESYDKIGGGHITLSVDGLGRSHDKIRGRDGLFRKIEQILDIFRAGNYSNILLKTTFVLFNENVEELIPVVEYFIKRNVPIFIQPYTNEKYQQSLAECRKDPLWIQNNKEDIFEDSLVQMMELKRRHPSLILNNSEHIRAMKDYFLKPEAALESSKRCYTGYRTVFVTPQGEVETCKGRALGSVRNNGFCDIWDANEFHEIRHEQLRCKENCMMGCVIDHSYYDLFRTVVSQLFKR